jgi:transposase
MIKYVISKNENSKYYFLQSTVKMVCKECQPEFEKLLKRVDELEKRLRQYENANMSSSRRLFPPRILNEKKKKPGQKPGHTGTTREHTAPTMSVELIEENCPHCKSKLDKPFKTKSKIIEEIPELPPIEIAEYKINHYRCKQCKKVVIAKLPSPEKSSFGPNTHAHVTLLKYEDRLPLRKVVASLKRQCNLSISSGTVFEMTNKVSHKLSPEYKKIRIQIRRSKSINIDETCFRVGGLNFHLWVFTNKNTTLYVIRKSRGKKVVEEVLGSKYKGVIGCDGWASYSSYTNRIQRCWAHLLREAKDLAEKHNSATFLHVGLKSIYEKATSKKPPDKETLILEMRQWIDYASSYKELRRFATLIRNGIEYWFTFLNHTGVEPTNNRAERALRELIVQRKIIGTLRNEKGTRIMETITSCLATWKQRGLSLLPELKSHLC